jgi:sigma-B regulation protein RsbU (phosphoserine phosphatase)
MRKLLLLIWLGACAASAQTIDGSHWPDGTIDIGQGWSVHEGDDPAWAQPGFDDRGWQTVDLDNQGAAQPGWRWYRLHLKLTPEHPHLHLLMAGGDGTYALYLNGRPAEGSGLKGFFGVRRPTEQVVSLPDEENDLTIALRTHAIPIYVGWHLPLFLSANLGTPDAIENQRLALESERLYAAMPSIAINLLLMLAGLSAFALYRSQGGHPEYLWLGLYLFLLGTSNGLLYCSVYGIHPLAWNIVFADPLVYVFTIMQIEFTFRFAGQRVGPVWRIYEAVLPLPLILVALFAGGWLSSSVYVLVQAILILPAALLLPVVLFLWFRRGNREAGWLILPSLLPAATTALYDLGSASIYTGWGKADFLLQSISIGPVPLQVSDLGDFLFVLAIAVVMFFRFTRVSREQTRVAAELEAAREMQQRLVPAKLPQVAGLTIEAAYFPALEVGGDFYQVMEQGDGSTLIVLGDVSGKGLKAAMTGALAIGALRTLAAQNLAPGALLARLNRQVFDTQDGGFITCICVRVGASGATTIANAGHLSPYRKGAEITLEPGLPLGLTPAVEYPEIAFVLATGDTITLLSDGVVEAMNAEGQLFGFERTRGLSGQSAAAIAAAAQLFGQEDDITVLTLTRTA